MSNNSTHYLGLVHGCEGNYGISFPDFPGCTSCGKSFEEIKIMGTEALAFCLEDYVEAHRPLPKPLTLEQIKKAPKFADWLEDIVGYVEIPVSAKITQAAE